jgi:hypothetical protein
MDALKDGLPIGIKVEEMGIENIRANKIHSLGSRISILAKISEFYQTNHLAEKLVTFFYTNYLRNKTHEAIQKFSEIHSNHPNKKVFCVVSTHYALAHAIASVKNFLERQLNIKIFLSTIVTDDSPQRIWAVTGSDLIFVPSKKTQSILSKYLPNSNIIKTVSFPISPKLNQKLDSGEFQRVSNQLNPEKDADLHIDIPISGAAVQLHYLQKLIINLSLKKFEFTVVGQESIYSIAFFEKLRKVQKVQLSIGLSARETVNLYESIFYQPNRPAVEITKPSEQTFKALINPSCRGGVILLLTNPVGRQEKDNLDFLTRHQLLPDNNKQNELEEYLLQNKVTDESEKSNWQYLASHWRGIRLPENPNKASIFIERLKETGILYSMLSYTAEAKKELTPDGVKQIWNTINNLI